MRYAWLREQRAPIPEALKTPLETAAYEARQIADNVRFAFKPGMGEGYALEQTGNGYCVTGGETGVLYGAHALARALLLKERLPQGVCQPHYALRMVDCWDNMDGTVERGYAGRSLWFEDDAFSYDPARIRQLGRMLASVGINTLCINNVNVHAPAQQLIGDLLPDLAAFADLLRPFGVRLMVSVDFSMPMLCGLDTADPLDSRVQAWWSDRAKAVYAAVPDLRGFLVKADSEHRPGPNAYGRNHAQGANMLARALKPFGGVLIWRAFVYNCLQDWRDRSVDRPCAACDTYLPLDGKFDDNVILQVKNGPYDFQVREPVSPLLLRIRSTAMALEYQLAQEYTGHQIDLYAMPPLWREVADTVGADAVQALACVSNLGRDENWFGHPFAALNLFAFGLFAWDPSGDPRALIEKWARLTYALPEDQLLTLTDLLFSSRSVYEQYTAPLGLCWMVQPGKHYGPNPYGYEFDSWGTYNRADRNAVGIDRTAAGTGYVCQYPEALKNLYSDPKQCPENLLLFFHRLPYDHVMADGRTLIQRIYDDHFMGCARAEAMADRLQTLSLPEPDRSEALRRMELQVENARNWRDVINTFFRRFSGVDDAQGRRIYD
ncbi:MAG: alpha-glucuronidase [Clostridia bacterium]|nr:alpha-glucuronidase [Clostridia bacterium]